MTQLPGWIACLFVGLFLSTCCLAQGAGWPSVETIRVERSFADRGAGGDTPFELMVRDISGASIYRIECHNGDYDRVVGFNYSGDFHCALFALKAEAVSSGNLLATEEEEKIGRDWYNRGRMLADQLSESCGLYPEYGAVRHFRLRGMLITFRFDALKWFPMEQFQRVRLNAFTFRVSVEPDLRATTAAAESVSEPRPPKSCGW